MGPAKRIDFAGSGVVNGVDMKGRRVFTSDGYVADAVAFKEVFGQTPEEAGISEQTPSGVCCKYEYEVALGAKTKHKFPDCAWGTLFRSILMVSENEVHFTPTNGVDLSCASNACVRAKKAFPERKVVLIFNDWKLEMSQDLIVTGGVNAPVEYAPPYKDMPIL